MNSPARSLCRLMCFAAVVLTVVWLWSVGGQRQLAPGRIIGGSMAPAFSGTPCFHVTCADCGFPFTCDAEQPPYRDLAVCPNCGYAENEVTPESRQSGEQVGIELGSFAVRLPRRWEVSALRSPNEAEAAYNMKRVVGLPGETISIRKGDLYANERLLRKSLDELKEVAVPVYDDRYRPTKTANLPARWQGEEGAKGWRMVEGGYKFDPSQSSDLEWLVYLNWACMANPLARTREVPVLDNDSYNQGVSRELHEVRDLLLTCRVKSNDQGSVGFALHDGREWFRVTLHPKETVAVLQRGEEELARARFPPRLLERGEQVEFALCDQQVLLAIGGEMVFRFPYEHTDLPVAPLSSPARLSALGALVEITDLRIWRDLHYLDPTGLGLPWTADARLQSGEYFVLGDNGAISIDSRFWKPESVRRETLLGRIRENGS